MTKPIKILSFNIQSGMGMDNRRSLSRIAWVIKCSGADLVGLQETDKYMKRSCFSSQARKLARLLGMHYVFGGACKPAFFSRFGNTILSKYPIKGHKNTLLPGTGEQRALLDVLININNKKIRFCNTHLGLSTSSRQKQVNKIIELLGEIQLPTILTGDFNTTPNDPVIEQLRACLERKSVSTESKNNDLKTYPSDRPSEKLDYIFLSAHWKEICQTTLPGQASDHLPLLAAARFIS
ncbi:Endonuclease/exonuclease/phosphatase [Desulfofarcimen acetoxidans DSM 771]|uniref:Endonuclease/exonuclease/phosphatase n=1 Tax=Desulfofarcimen acetoxidans (strain ATCC 49208 / DSM 771 / KCTC 5769 / VKM B-1644 / 5575) TaxID=485916 RepID=C8VVU4_DESAS|nr:endonuclease/exonuclease/phosphatase family protein [Desulfofarcimen acetoxidans]ACV64231.1 Endonuclease/exonuclease/phosphatase [Desulfofarcimen acetoxidans DSM 771]